MGAQRFRMRLDPGWFYVVAGLAMCAAGILVPAQRDVEALRGQLARLAGLKAISDARLDAHATFLRQLEQRDPSLMRRLAAGQLNLVPAGEQPVLLASSSRATVSEWIDETVRVEADAPQPPPVTLLSRLTSGPYRLWVFAGGMIAVFAGLLYDPGRARAGQLIVPRWVLEQSVVR